MTPDRARHQSRSLERSDTYPSTARPYYQWGSSDEPFFARAPPGRHAGYRGALNVQAGATAEKTQLSWRASRTPTQVFACVVGLGQISKGSSEPLPNVVPMPADRAAAIVSWSWKLTQQDEGTQCPAWAPCKASDLVRAKKLCPRRRRFVDPARKRDLGRCKGRRNGNSLRSGHVAAHDV